MMVAKRSKTLIDLVRFERPNVNFMLCKETWKVRKQIIV